MTAQKPISVGAVPDNRFLWFFNGLLFVAVLYTLALLAFGFDHFIASYPISDTWKHVEFLTLAANGTLDWSQIFERHNFAHLLVIPKLVYYFDMHFAQGSGVLTAVVALLFVVTTALIIVSVLFSHSQLDTREKWFLSLVGLVFLLSPLQVESLFNPANFQWACLNFFSVLTAFYCFKFYATENKLCLAGIGTCVIGVGLTSASAFLILVPLLIYILAMRCGVWRFLKNLLFLTGGVVFLFVVWEVIRYFQFSDSPSLLLKMMALFVPQEEYLRNLETGVTFFNENGLKAYLFWAINVFSFLGNFFIPVLARLDSLVIMIVANGLMIASLTALINSVRLNSENKNHITIFFSVLLLFGLFCGAVIAIVKSPITYGYTYRFANLGLLFSFSLLVLLYLQFRKHVVFRNLIVGATLLYVGTVGVVQGNEVAAFGKFQSHIRGAQTAYALDIKHPPAVVSMPGTAWQDVLYDWIQTYKHLLKNNQLGVYASEAFKRVGQKLEIPNSEFQVCEYKITKKRRLLPEQAAWRLTGKTKTQQGDNITTAFFVDQDDVVRGWAIDMSNSKSLKQLFQQGRYWGGYVLLPDKAQDVAAQAITVYAYDGEKFCQPYNVKLPEYREP